MKSDREDDMSMDDILASIRRYVTDDVEETPDNRIIRLTPDYEVDSPHALKRDSRPVSEPRKDTRYAAPVSSQEFKEDPVLLSDHSLKASAQAFSKLSEVKPSRSSVSIEQFVSTLIKEWLDQNLPSIVERIVEKEVERIKKAM